MDGYYYAPDCEEEGTTFRRSRARLRPDSNLALAGFVPGVLVVAFLPALPPRWLLPWALLATSLVLLARATRPWLWHRLCSPAHRWIGESGSRPAIARASLSAGAGLLGGVVLAVWFGQGLLERRLTEGCVRLPLEVQGVVSSLPVASQFRDGVRRQRFEFRVAQLTPGRCAGPATVLLSYYGEATVRPGETWRFQVRLKRPWGLANPASHNLQAWFAQTGIDAVGSAGSGQHVAGAGLFDAPHHRLRARLARAIDEQQFGAEATAMLKALTVADKSAIDGGLWRLFQIFGINHLLVISGLHIGLVAGLGFLVGGVVARMVGVRALHVPALSALLLAAAYAALAGFSLSTQRALCMLAAPLAAVLLGRSSATPRALLLAAVIVLAINPLSGLGSGFWLSFGAVATLLWTGCWRHRQGRVVTFLRTHLCMSLMMVPLGAWFFGGVSLVAALANMVMIPLVGFVVVPAALAGAAGYMAGLPVYAWLWSVAVWPLERLLPLAADLAGSSAAWLYRPVASDAPGAALALVAVVVLVTPAGAGLRLASLVLLAPLLLLRPAMEPLRPGVLHATVLDVGQGTAVVLRSASHTLVYDTGGGDPGGSNIATNVLLPYLARYGVTRLDTLVVSHGDLDHSAGLDAVLARLPVGRLRMGSPPPRLAQGARCRAGEAWRWPDGIAFQMLSPAPGEQVDSNDRSCVLRVAVGGYQLLLPGDVEGRRERAIASYWPAELASDWLLVGHHGSRTSTTWPFLKRVSPAEAVVSSGYANRFGHPHPMIVERLEAVGATVHNTAASGALEFRIGPQGLQSVHSYREKYHRYWM